MLFLLLLLDGFPLGKIELFFELWLVVLAYAAGEPPLTMAPTRNNATAIDTNTRNFVESLFFDLVNLVNNKALIDIKVAKVFGNRSHLGNLQNLSYSPK